ncbi:hypothetical protein HNP84_006976 [Thermocatellispora tengchongensis]|uniref:Uncharacterized protein n=1 Tax=Thermocatellispora tengchongensis TaxID=1073253 RepID=A0A840P7A3_9ACTN|nr:hypothetical protein [Thermocatellispora tengchongensis]
MRWTTTSIRKLAAELTRQGHKVSADTVADLLHQEGFSLQGNAKTLEGEYGCGGCRGRPEWPWRPSRRVRPRAPRHRGA